jgi:Spy/CpxP family protein refolding chaperone
LPPAHSHRDGRPRPAANAIRSLTPEQRAAWQSIQSDLRASTESLREQERAVAEQLHAAREDADAKLAALLTPEQKQKFAAFHAVVEFLKERRPGPGGPGGPR